MRFSSGKRSRAITTRGTRATIPFSRRSTAARPASQATSSLHRVLSVLMCLVPSIPCCVYNRPTSQISLHAPRPARIYIWTRCRQATPRSICTRRAYTATLGQLSLFSLPPSPHPLFYGPALALLASPLATPALLRPSSRSSRSPPPSPHPLFYGPPRHTRFSTTRAKAHIR
jgi:hypothetical protein